MSSTTPRAGATSVKPMDTNPCPHEAFVLVQAHALQSIARLVSERGACWKENKGGKGNARRSCSVARRAKEGVPQGTREQGPEGSEGVSHGDIQRRHLLGQDNPKYQGPERCLECQQMNEEGR